MFKKERILVTGGTGFIGSFLVERLLAEGATVRVPIRAKNYRALSHRRGDIEWLEGDLRDPEYCRDLVASVDRVFHLASCRRNVSYHQDKCSDVLNANVGMTLALLEAIRERDPMPVVVFSTANVPLDTDVIAVARAKLVDGYILGKALSEVLWLTAQRQRHFPLLIVRPVGVYGPRDTFAEDGNVIPALMVKAQRTDALHVWGSGKQERAFLYVEDLVDAMLTLVEARAEGVQYITAPEAWTVKELAESIRDIVRPGLPVVFDAKKPEGAPRIIPLPMHPSLRKFPWTPLSEGLWKTYESWNGAALRPKAVKKPAKKTKEKAKAVSGKRSRA